MSCLSFKTSQEISSVSVNFDLAVLLSHRTVVWLGYLVYCTCICLFVCLFVCFWLRISEGQKKIAV